MMQIQLELRSDTAPGGGEGEAGGIDRDIIHGANGLPRLPARRIKGCLREAALEVREALQQVGREELLPAARINRLFGSPYQDKELSRPGYLQLSDAVLQEATELEAWLKWAAKKDKSLFGPANILKSYTGQRAQTSMARVTGGPLSNTLRVSRVIRQGCIFIAQVDLVVPPGQIEQAGELEEMRRVLAWACLALRHIGLSRNRGLGHVKVSLEDQSYSNQQALDDLARQLGQGEAK